MVIAFKGPDYGRMPINHDFLLIAPLIEALMPTSLARKGKANIPNRHVWRKI